MSECVRVIELMTTEEVAKMLGKTPVTVYNYRKKGMPYISIKSGSKSAVRFDRQEVLEWASKHIQQ